MSITITTVEHAVANVAHEIVVGAKAAQKIIDKAEAVIVADAPTVEKLTALIDPRAADIERIGAALIGEIEPQISKVLTDVENAATNPTVSLSTELWTELKALYASLTSEISTAKAAVTAS